MKFYEIDLYQGSLNVLKEVEMDESLSLKDNLINILQKEYDIENRDDVVKYCVIHKKKNQITFKGEEVSYGLIE